MKHGFEKHQEGTVIHFKNGYMAIVMFHLDNKPQNELANMIVFDPKGDWVFLSIDNVWKTITYLEETEQDFSMDRLNPEQVTDMLYQISKFN